MNEIFIILWYVCIAGFMANAGWLHGKRAKNHRFMISFTLMFPWLFVLELLFSPYFAIFPPTLAISAMVNLLEFGSFILGYAISWEWHKK